MATITQIEIDGFKAFPANFTLNLGTGKKFALIRRERKRQIFIVLCPSCFTAKCNLKMTKVPNISRLVALSMETLLQRMKISLIYIDTMKQRIIHTLRIYVLHLKMVRFGDWIIEVYYQKTEVMKVKLGY